MFGIGFAAVNESAQTADAVVLSVEVGAAQKPALFGDEEEEEAVDQAEQGLIEGFGRRVPVGICPQKARAQDFEALLHAVS